MHINGEGWKSFSINGINKRYFLNQIKWFGIYIGAGFFLSILLPFPMSFVRCLGIFFIIGIVRVRPRLKNLSISPDLWNRTQGNLMS
ncbi:MAG: hypothetical protein ACRD8Z_13195 [Nitrososphaeraceae archaeon]